MISGPRAVNPLACPEAARRTASYITTSYYSSPSVARVLMPLEFLSPLHKASRQLSVYLEARTQELGVSPIEGHLLTYLKSYAPAPIGELVRVFGLKQSTFTSILDRLESPGFIHREMNPNDRRSFLIHITEDGRKLASRINRILVTLEDDIRTHASPRSVAGFHAVMRAVEEVTQVTLRER
jgi:MarR family transcriptional regulator, organic hydroperoxide resistance regulator